MAETREGPKKNNHEKDAVYEQERGKTEIIKLHQEIALTLLALKEDVDAMVPPGKHDPSGWRIYFFDPKTTTDEQIQNLESDIKDPLFQITFRPSSKNFKDELLPTTIDIDLLKGDSPVFLTLYPMGSDTIEWTRLSVDLPDYKSRPGARPKICSEIDISKPDWDSDREANVLVNDLPILKVNTALEKAEQHLEEVAGCVRNLSSGKLRARVFGNSHKSPMSPLFISPNQLNLPRPFRKQLKH